MGSKLATGSSLHQCDRNFGYGLNLFADLMKNPYILVKILYALSAFLLILLSHVEPIRTAWVRFEIEILQSPSKIIDHFNIINNTFIKKTTHIKSQYVS